MKVKKGRITTCIVLGCVSLAGMSLAAPAVAASVARVHGSSRPAAVPSAWAKLRAEVPATYRHAGVITVADTPFYPPYELYNSKKQIVGIDPELAQAMGTILGLEFKFIAVTFGEIPTALASGRYDIGMSAIGDFKSREKVVKFMDYALAREAFLAPIHGSFKATSLSQICGDTVAAQASTSEATQLREQSTICTKEGKKPVNVLTYPSQSSVVLAVKSGRAPAFFADFAAGSWIARQTPGKFRVSAVTDPAIKGLSGHLGIAFPKSSQLLRPIEGAMQLLMSDGQYQKIFTKWGVKEEESDRVYVDAGVAT